MSYTEISNPNANQPQLYQFQKSTANRAQRRATKFKKMMSHTNAGTIMHLANGRPMTGPSTRRH